MARDDIGFLDVEEITAETDKSLCVDAEDTEGSIWVPKSLIRNLDEAKFKKGDKRCTFELPEWWMTQQGLL